LEDKKCVYGGAAAKVQLAGDFTNWNPSGAVLQNVGGNTKATVLEFPVSARVEGSGTQVTVNPLSRSTHTEKDVPCTIRMPWP